MTWILFTLLGYFCLAVSQLLDKFLLSGERIPRPSVYAFYVSLFSLFSLLFAPFGFAWLPFWLASLFLFSGFFFVYGLLAFYYAVKTSEISRIAPLVGLITSVTVLLFSSFSPDIFGEGSFTIRTLMALGLFVIGGLLISYDLPLRKHDHLSWTVLLAGTSIGFSLLLLKFGYLHTNFVSGLVWSRIGMFAAGLTLLLVPIFRQEIWIQHEPKKMADKKSLVTFAIFLFNKTCAGTASFLILYATALGSVSFVQALSGMQYVFLLLLSLPLSARFPHIFGEKLSFWDWFQKGVALLIIGAAFFVVGISGLSIK